MRKFIQHPIVKNIVANVTNIVAVLHYIVICNIYLRVYIHWVYNIYY